MNKQSFESSFSKVYSEPEKLKEQEKEILKKKMLIFIIFLPMILMIGYQVQHKSAKFYQNPIMEISKIKEEDGYKVIEGKILNKNGEFLKLTIDNQSVTGLTTHLRIKDQVLLNEDLSTVISEKRDGLAFSIVTVFLLILLLVGKTSGLRAFIGLCINLLLLLLSLRFEIVYPSIPTLFVIIIYAALSIIVTFLSNYGIHAFRFDLIAATYIIVLLGFLICFTALKFMGNKGIRFEEMQFLTRPYLGVFYSSLIFGGIGAGVDMIVTLVTPLKELIRQKPTITTLELVASGRRIAKDVTPSMINVLMFAYLSGSLPMIIFYLNNGWSLVATLEMHLSLEILRVFCGAFVILLSVPASLLCVLWKGGLQ